jgi:hypothetical protein
MKSKKAFIKLDGKIGEKEISSIEYIDHKYLEKLHIQKKELNDLILKIPKRDSNIVKHDDISPA